MKPCFVNTIPPFYSWPILTLESQKYVSQTSYATRFLTFDIFLWVFSLVVIIVCFRKSYCYCKHSCTKCSLFNTFRPFQCSLCSASFKTKANLLNHHATHTGEKKHKCEHCGQQFAHKTSLTLHYRWHSGKQA